MLRSRGSSRAMASVTKWKSVRVGRQHAIRPGEDFAHVGMHLSQRAEARPGFRHEQGGTHAVAAHVADDKSQATIQHGDVIEIIAGRGFGRIERPASSKPSSLGGHERIEPLLDFARRAELLGCVAERFFGMIPPAALDGIADGSNQQAVGQLALDQIILCPGLHGLDGGSFVVVAREDHDRHFAGMRVQVEKSFQTGAVGQAEVQQHDVELLLFAALDGRGEQFHLNQFERAVPTISQQIPHDVHVVRIVLDQQDFHAFFVHLRSFGGPWSSILVFSGGGNSTTRNQ